MRAREVNAERGNAGVYSGKHGQRRLLFGLPRWCWVAFSIYSSGMWRHRAVLLALFIFSFFRDPERVIPRNVGCGVSGRWPRVVVTDEENAGRPGKRVSIFLAVWNVHVTGRRPRNDFKDRVRPGKFLAALRERLPWKTSRTCLRFDRCGQIVFKQIAGLIARRVVSWKKPGDKVARGERIGLVRFGSRVTCGCQRAEIFVKVGENVKGGRVC